MSIVVSGSVNLDMVVKSHRMPGIGETLTGESVSFSLKQLQRAKDEDCMFPNHGRSGPLRHEDLLGRVIQPAAEKLCLPHITWRLLRHWGATQMVEASVAIKAVQERPGHSRPYILLKFYAHVLDASAHDRPVSTARIKRSYKG